MHMKKYKQKYKLTHQREAPDRLISQHGHLFSRVARRASASLSLTRRRRMVRRGANLAYSKLI